MDAIDKSIEKGRHITQIEVLKEQTWDGFLCESEDRKIIAYGAGDALRTLSIEYPGLRVSLIVDKDESKQGKRVDELFVEAHGTLYSDLTISRVSEMDRFEKDDVCVLILGLKTYEEVYEELREKGYRGLYSFLCMEEKERRRVNYGEWDYDDIRDCFLCWCSTLPIIKNKIVFQSFNTYSDHGKYITKQLINKNKDLDIVWILNKESEECPADVRMININDWKMVVREMETASCWVINSQLPEYVVKKEGQIYIHTKHWASITLKRFYLDAPTILHDIELKNKWENEFPLIDHIITGSKFDEESCRRGFGFRGEFISAGSPRSDAMFEAEKHRSKVYDFLGLDNETNTLLYAPTYRYAKNEKKLKHENRSQQLDYELLRYSLSKRFGGKWVIIRRLHPSLANYASDETLPEGVIDVSLYEDGEELCAASDVLITDYSSIMFEPAFVGRPVFLFSPDRNDYVGVEYDLLLDYDSLPFPIACNNEELSNSIVSFDETEYKNRLHALFETYDVHEDGHASERAANAILEMMKTL